MNFEREIVKASPCGQYVQMKDIPPPRGPVDPQKVDAFREVLKQLFNQYPVFEELLPRQRLLPREYRKSALDTDDPRLMTYRASDTGVPNDILLAHYTALFR